MSTGFRRNQTVRIRKAFRDWYPGYDEGWVIQPTSLGIAVKVRFGKSVKDWIDMNHLEKR